MQEKGREREPFSPFVCAAQELSVYHGKARIHQRCLMDSCREVLPMAEITAQMVRELRERTGAGIMDCKKALKETGGDMTAAVDYLREKGLAAAAKKAGRTAAEGLVDTYISEDQRVGSLVEVNCETDFVAKNEDFQKFVKAVARHIVEKNPLYVNSEEAPEGAEASKILLEQPFLEDSTKTVGEVLREKIATIGENMAIRRFSRFAVAEGAHGVVASYIHLGGRVGVLVELAVDKEVNKDALVNLARELGMQIAAMKPEFVARQDVTEDVLERERAIYRNAALNEGKPERVVDRIVEGRLEKFFKEACLLDQEYVKNSDMTVKQLIEKVSNEVGATVSVVRFARYEKGEGIEKKQEDFAAEVMAELNK